MCPYICHDAQKARLFSAHLYVNNCEWVNCDEDLKNSNISLEETLLVPKDYTSETFSLIIPRDIALI